MAQKKPSKINSLLHLLKPSTFSRKAAVLIIIALIAVLGSGWLTYRSFAATSTFKAECYSTYQGICRMVSHSQNSKNNGHTAQLTKGGIAVGSNWYFKVGQKYRTCANVRPVTYSSFIIDSGRNDGVSAKRSFHMGANSKYTTFCTAWVTSRSTGYSRPMVITSDGLLHVAYTYFEVQ